MGLAGQTNVVVDLTLSSSPMLFHFLESLTVTSRDVIFGCFWCTFSRLALQNNMYGDMGGLGHSVFNWRRGGESFEIL